MGRTFRLAYLLLGVFLLCTLAQALGCSAKDIRYPEDHTRYANIDRAVEELRKAYAARDLSAVQSLIVPVEALERMTSDVQQDFNNFQDITLEWTIDRIVIDGNIIEAVVNWAGQWRRTPADTGIRERGQGVLRWTGEKSVLLTGAEGDLPFGMASRRAASEKPSSGRR